MNALILCAGYGTRLKTLTNNTPKTMIKIAGKPVLQHLVDHLKKYNIKDIIVNTHYKPDKIYHHFGKNLSYFYEPELLGDFVTTQKVMYMLKGNGIVMNGDTLTDLDIEKLIKDTKKHESSIASFDEMKYTGTTCYYENRPIIIKRYGCYWQDIGTPEGLARARKKYENSYSLPKLL